ncbi:MAG: DUF2029 domain-containing protein [Oligoflexia bacterium]|nr:DUF2029 domain-containing protein [Oligoflexia bacterium]
MSRVSNLITLLLLLLFGVVWSMDQGAYLQRLLIELDQYNYLLGDFRNVYYPAAQAFASGARPVEGFFYSPFFLMLVVPFARLPYEQAALVWGLGQLIIGVIFFRFCLSLGGQSMRLVWLRALVVLISMPVLSCLRWGQVSILLALLAAAVVTSLEQGRVVLAAACTALLISLKYYGAMFVPLFAFRRAWRAMVLALALVLVFLVLLPIVALGPATVMLWYAAALDGLALAQSTWISEHINSQYLVHVLGRVGGAMFLSPGPKFCVALLGVFVALVCYRCAATKARQTSRSDMLESFCLISLATPFIVSTSWPHYFVYLPICQIVVLDKLSKLEHARSPYLLAFGLGLSIAFSAWPICLLLGGWQRYNGAGLLLLSNLVLLGLFLFWEELSVERK